MHSVPVYYAYAITVPVLPPATYVPVIDIDDFLFDDDEEDDDELFELPPGGPAASIASEAPLPPNVPVLDLDAFLLTLICLLSCFQTVRLSTLIQRWASVLPLIWLAR